MFYRPYCIKGADTEKLKSRLNLNNFLMKNFIYRSLVAVFAFTAFAAFYSCSSEDEDSAYITDTSGNSSLAWRMDNALLEIMENKDGRYTEGGNICYFADEDTLMVLDNWTYTLCSLINEYTSEK